MLPFRFSRIDRWLQSPAPTLGQHNDEVLRELGYSAEFIVTLSEKGILGTTPQGQ
jgi:crotonobetainyl-CoA:carnitine CoA-transferase CaiB-like acyl-CoA transferase